jgi:heme A synthase
MVRDFLRLSILALMLAVMTAGAVSAAPAPTSTASGLLEPDMSTEWWKDNR